MYHSTKTFARKKKLLSNMNVANCNSKYTNSKLSTGFVQKKKTNTPPFD
jgi:hypothetical protein